MTNGQYGTNRRNEAANVVQTCCEVANMVQTCCEVTNMVQTCCEVASTVQTEEKKQIIWCRLDEAANMFKRMGQRLIQCKPTERSG
jgi:hypothetical protein